MSFLEKLEEVATNALKNVRIFDPSTLNDELAMKTEWKPTVYGGANFTTNKLVEISPSKLGYKPTIMGYGFPMIFISAFAFVPLFMASFFVEQFGSIVYIVAVAFGLSAVVGGFFILRSVIKPRIFDKRIGLFFKGQKEYERRNHQSTKNQCRLNDIYAIQLLKKQTTNNSSNNQTSHTNYEINLVLNDTFRLNVITRSDMYQTRKDANTIAEFLDVPVWDAI